MEDIDDGKLQRGRSILLRMAEDLKRKPFWTWLEDRPDRAPTDLDMKTANKFFLGAILDWQMTSKRAQESAKNLAESTLGDPDNLWQEVSQFSIEEWNALPSVHRFPAGHTRVWKIGNRLLEAYDGDARAIWEDQDATTVLIRLEDLGVGPQLSRMITGALLDTGNVVSGALDIKVDRHTLRVLGRLFLGRILKQPEEAKATKLARQVMPPPKNPWGIDRPLHHLGRSTCHDSDPACRGCPLRDECSYFANSLEK